MNGVLLKDNRKLARLARSAGGGAGAKNGKTSATKDDVREGLVAAVKVTFSEPQFRGQTKQELGTPRSRASWPGSPTSNSRSGSSPEAAPGPR